MSIDFSVVDGVALVRLNRPEAMNSIDPETRVELREIWQRIAADGAVRAAVLTGTGERAFCAGTDLKKTAKADGSFAGAFYGDAGVPSLVDGLAMDKPVIAAVNGVALGGGFELALACDIRIASETARFGLPEVKVGSIPGAGGTQRLPRTIPHSAAMLMLLTGDAIDAAEALRLGLVSKVVPAAALLDEAMAIAARIAANAPLSVRAIKRLVRIGGDAPLSVALEHERHAFGLIRDTEDRAEGRRAFGEKRPPQFRGR